MDLIERVTKIEVKLDATLPTLATRADVSELRVEMHSALREQTWKMITSAAVLVAATAAIVKYFH